MQASNGNSPSTTSPVHRVQTSVAGSPCSIGGHIPPSSDSVKISPSAARGMFRTYDISIVLFYPVCKRMSCAQISHLRTVSENPEVSRERHTSRRELL